MAQQLEQWADEELKVRTALPPEVNHVLSALWSGLAAMGLALFALLPMTVHDWQRQGMLDWAGEWKDWLGMLVAAAMSLAFLVVGGLGTLWAVKARPRGLTLTKWTAGSSLVVGAALSIAIFVLIIQGQFKLGPTPILAGALLVVIALLPVFLSGLTLSLATVDAVREFFYPPEEVAVETPAAEEVPVEEVAAGVTEEELERSLGELPTGQSAAPPLSVPGEIIRAELDESRLIRAELDTEAGEIIRAELDEDRLIRAELDEESLVRAELDEERLIVAEPASTELSPAAGPVSDIFQAEASPRSTEPIAELDIERIGDTASRVLSRADLTPESPSAVMLSALTESPSPSGVVKELLEAPPSEPGAGLEVAPPVRAQEGGEVAAEVSAATFPAEAKEQSAPASPGDSEDAAASEEIFATSEPPAPRSETSAIDLERLQEMECLAEAERQPISEPETPVHLSGGEPELVSEAAPPESPLSAPSAGETARGSSEGQAVSGADVLFPELADTPFTSPTISSQEQLAEQPFQPLPPSDELFREIALGTPETSEAAPQPTPSPTQEQLSTHGENPASEQKSSSEEIFRIADEPDTEIRWESDR